MSWFLWSLVIRVREIWNFSGSATFSAWMNLNYFSERGTWWVGEGGLWRFLSYFLLLLAILSLIIPCIIYSLLFFFCCLIMRYFLQRETVFSFLSPKSPDLRLGIKKTWRNSAPTFFLSKSKSFPTPQNSPSPCYRVSHPLSPPLLLSFFFFVSFPTTSIHERSPSAYSTERSQILKPPLCQAPDRTRMEGKLRRDQETEKVAQKKCIKWGNSTQQSTILRRLVCWAWIYGNFYSSPH